MTNNTNETKNAEIFFSIQRIYLKDCSFETPHAPEIFREEWQPKVDFELQIMTQQLDVETYEVSIWGTTTANMNGKIAFLAEAKQAGIFTLRNIPTDQIPLLLNITCPTILFPYFRETISNLISRGSFPQLILDPINFEALYQQKISAAESSSSKETVQ